MKYECVGPVPGDLIEQVWVSLGTRLLKIPGHSNIWPRLYLACLQFSTNIFHLPEVEARSGSAFGSGPS